MNTQDFNAGIEAACKYLESTASDFDQIANNTEAAIRAGRSGVYGTLGKAAQMVTGQQARDKAVLLRGQVFNLRMDVMKK